MSSKAVREQSTKGLYVKVGDDTAQVVRNGAGEYLLAVEDAGGGLVPYTPEDDYNQAVKALDRLARRARRAKLAAADLDSKMAQQRLQHKAEDMRRALWLDVFAWEDAAKLAATVTECSECGADVMEERS